MVSTRARQYDPYSPFEDVPPGTEVEVSLAMDLGAAGAVVFQARPKAATDMVYGDGSSETTGASGKKTHTYAYNGTYEVTATQGAKHVTEHITVDNITETVPGAPTTVTGVDGTDGTAVLTWVAPTSDGHSLITGYRIDSTVDDGTTWVVEVADTDSTDVSDVVVTVDPGSYKFRVAAINAHGVSTPSGKSAAITVTDV